MAKTLDLRKKVPTAAAPAPAPADGPLQGLPGFPQSEGTILRPTPDEEALLRAVNWQPGEPVPNLAAALDAIKSAPPTLPDPNMPKVPMPREISIDELPADQREALLANVSKMLDTAKRTAAVPHVEEPGGKDVNDGIRKIATGAGDVEITLNRGAGTAAPAAPPAPVADTAPLATVGPVATICQNCNYDNNHDIVQVTPEDIRGFLAMLVGGAPRFYKTYELFGGRLAVTFRTLTRAELDMAVTQAGCDDRDGLVPTPADFVRRSQNYEMLLGLAGIRRGDNAPDEFPQIADVQVDESATGAARQTPLKTYSAYLEDAVGSASMLRILTVNFGRFYELVRRMEANQHNPDFWDGIVLP